jgi:hypothetical protein
MSEDGTWKKELGEKDQIIAPSTKVVELQSKLDKQVMLDFLITYGSYIR